MIILNKGLKTIFLKISEYSLVIYLIHAFVIFLLNILLNKIGINPENFIFYPIIWFGTIVISYLFALLYEKTSTASILQLST